MSDSKDEPGNDEAVDQLIEFLGKGDLDVLENSLEKLGVKQQSEIFRKTCELAGQLHESLMTFKKSLCNSSVNMSSTTIPDAADKLENVMKMTFDAANKTIDELEVQTELLEGSKKSLEEGLEKIAADERICAESKEYLTALLNDSKDKIDQSLVANFKVITAQEYQDLTGQALQKVIKLVQELEGGLVSVVKLFGIDFNVTEGGQEETTVIESEGKISQDCIDDLLKDF